MTSLILTQEFAAIPIRSARGNIDEIDNLDCTSLDLISRYNAGRSSWVLVMIHREQFTHACIQNQRSPPVFISVVFTGISSFLGIVLQTVIYVFVTESTGIKIAVTTAAAFVVIPLLALLPSTLKPTPSSTKFGGTLQPYDNGTGPQTNSTSA